MPVAGGKNLLFSSPLAFRRAPASTIRLSGASQEGTILVSAEFQADHQTTSKQR